MKEELIQARKAFQESYEEYTKLSLQLSEVKKKEEKNELLQQLANAQKRFESAYRSYTFILYHENS